MPAVRRTCSYLVEMRSCGRLLFVGLGGVWYFAMPRASPRSRLLQNLRISSILLCRAPVRVVASYGGLKGSDILLCYAPVRVIASCRGLEGASY